MSTLFRLKLAVLVLFAFGAAAACWGGWVERADAGAAQTADADQYLGAEVCAACHQEKFTQFAATPHYALVTDPHVKVSDKGCEACHGPGAAHVQAAGDPKLIFNPRKATAKEVAARCTRCHVEKTKDGQPYHVEHDPEAVGCNDCHSPHQPKTNPYLLVKDAPDLCLGCHKEVASDFRKPFHHKVLEGGVSCRDCHSGHGRWNTAEAHKSAEGFTALCSRCHSDMHGPFAFEHPAATHSSDGCLACHTPHGSVNNRLLNRNTVFQLCIQCHGEIGLTADVEVGIYPHDLSDPRIRECTVCHTQIHGSNANDRFLN